MTLRFIHRRGTTEEYEHHCDLIPYFGEVCVDIITWEIKFGDGARPWINLPVAGHLPDYLREAYIPKPVVKVPKKKWWQIL